MKKTMYCYSLAATIAVSLSSCNTHKVGITELKKYDAKINYHFDYDPTRRAGLILYDSAGNMKVLAEVQPDAVVTKVTDLATKLTGKIKGNEASIENALKIAESMAELGKRSVAGSILRDALYRLAEMSISHASMSTTQKELFDKIMGVAEKIALAEVAAEKAKEEKAKANQEEAKANQEEAKARQEDAKARLEQAKADRAESEARRTEALRSITR